MTHEDRDDDQATRELAEKLAALTGGMTAGTEPAHDSLRERG
jgi:hypothetical protein